MNRGMYIALVPPLLVAAGYLLIFRFTGLSPSYPRLIAGTVIFFGAIYWLYRRGLRKEKASKQ